MTHSYLIIVEQREFIAICFGFPWERRNMPIWSATSLTIVTNNDCDASKKIFIHFSNEWRIKNYISNNFTLITMDSKEKDLKRQTDKRTGIPGDLKTEKVTTQLRYPKK